MEEAPGEEGPFHRSSYTSLANDEAVGWAFTKDGGPSPAKKSYLGYSDGERARIGLKEQADDSSSPKEEEVTKRRGMENSDENAVVGYRQ